MFKITDGDLHHTRLVQVHPGDLGTQKPTLSALLILVATPADTQHVSTTPPTMHQGNGRPAGKLAR